MNHPALWLLPFVVVALPCQGVSIYYMLRAQVHLTPEAEARWGWWLVPLWLGPQNFTAEGQRFRRLSIFWSALPFVLWGIFVAVLILVQSLSRPAT